MATPAVRISEQDGQLGALPPSFGRPLAIVGTAASGPTNEPALFAGSAGQKALIETFTAGPLVEAAALAIARGAAVCAVRAATSTEGSYPEDDVAEVTGGGTSTVTVDDTTHPNDDYEVFVIFREGATIGQSGAVYQWSLDGGRTLSQPTALGTANSITLPGTGGIKIDFDAGTVLAGQTIAFRTKAPQWDNTSLGAALDALKTSSINWEICEILGDLDPTAFDVVEGRMAQILALGKDRCWIGHVRVPEAGESESAYRAALETDWASKATVLGGITAGSAEIVSAVSSRAYMRPPVFALGPLLATVSEEVDIAALDVGLLQGVSIRDRNGNPKHHDEHTSPGLDDLRFSTLRTWEEAQGVYFTNPRLFSPSGSDFEFIQHRRVMNLARSTLRAYFVRRLSKPIRVSRKTGFILEEEAVEIERGATRQLESVLLAKPKASDALCVLSRTDNLLSTKTITVTGKIVPLAYPKFIDVGMSFANPALQVIAV